MKIRKIIYFVFREILYRKMNKILLIFAKKFRFLLDEAIIVKNMVAEPEHFRHPFLHGGATLYCTICTIQFVCVYYY
jgi:hypothetical protein